MSMKYDPNFPMEQDRLKKQAEILKAFDNRLFETAMKRFDKLPKVGIDLGCSRGYAAFNRFGNYDHFERILGIDIDSDSLQIASKESEKYLANWTFKKASLEEPEELAKAIGDFLEGYTEPVLVWSAFVFHFFKDPMSIFKALQKLLPVGSVIIIRTLDDLTPVFYPDPNNLLKRVKLSEHSKFSDAERHHARKLPFQFIESGLSNPEMISETIFSSNMNSEEKELHRYVWFSFYEQLAVYQAGQIEDPRERKKFLKEYAEVVEEQKQLFQDPKFSMLLSFFGGIAEVRS